MRGSGLSSLEINDFKIKGLDDPASKQMTQIAFAKLSTKLPARAVQLLKSLVITVGDGITDSGAQTNAEAGTIILDNDKNSLSLKQAEDYLMVENYLNKGDWTNVLSDIKNDTWSCLTYQLVHEVGHVIDGRAKGKKYSRLEPNKSPTKYGRTNSSEAFAEAFTYWVFDTPLDPKTERTITDLVSENWGEL